MPKRRITYHPNPAHKTATSEAGPPRWFPGKTACPTGMTLAERDAIVASSVPETDDALNPARYAVERRDGDLLWFKTLLTREHPDGRIEIHGVPFVPGYPKVPTRVLRRMRELGQITDAEYRKMVKA